MNNYIIFSFPGNKDFAQNLANKLRIEEGELVMKRFPDGESYVRINSTVRNKIVILFCTMNNPDKKILSLMFTAQTLKELGAKKIILISPYLPYMRQDIRFNPGEAITSRLFAKFLSNWIDYLITVDPHLHRIHHLSCIYSIPVLTLHAHKEIAQWIKENINYPFLIGPDSESKQWVSGIAEELKAPYVVCNKIRLSDQEVKIDIPRFSSANETLILMDDIISTGSSMVTILKQLSLQGYRGICLAIHPLFSKKAKEKLVASGALAIITCNSISDPTNKINILDLIAANLEKIMGEI
ncbi:ribose-phosphate pyrophosphokinase [Legionella birminghamensis]|uniref:ribose-phosphate diphosphokinase n=1 Tax=Legionella birminghamensis TaxID=28083 RepID=A0A378I936_9GAMM|nr:ribose-phosphate diphosphokinase [Legionella birminghamensis]KTC67939.1 ribose-phosphate pyrophosphokinase [Legionella birminghamensis]STX31352.1 ribose-phosphate pyrophosphokinase [Legionella birminghamensis]